MFQTINAAVTAYGITFEVANAVPVDVFATMTIRAAASAR
jgi:hypothetical protein